MSGGYIDTSSKAIPKAATARSLVDSKADKAVLHQIVHANDAPGTRYYDPSSNPYQGAKDHTKKAERDYAAIIAKHPKAAAHVESVSK